MLRLALCTFISLATASSASAEYSRRGYPICDSLEHLEGLNSKTTANFTKQGWCSYIKGGIPVSVVSRSKDGIVEIKLDADGNPRHAWAHNRAVSRFKPAEPHNILLSDGPERPAQLCMMLSQRLDVSELGTDVLARDTLAHVEPAKHADVYKSALEKADYDLVVAWDHGVCRSNLYVSDEQPARCVIDTNAFWECVHSGGAEKRDACFSALCTERVHH